MQLSENFKSEEFEKNDAIPELAIEILTRLAKEILEPVRAQFGPLAITSGYRSPLANAAAHGIQNSEHIYTSDWAACDFFANDGQVGSSRTIFDWMRLNATLPYHQLILEHDANGLSVVHVSINRNMIGIRSVLEGATHNAEPYAKVDHAEYNA